ncbi:NAD-dependent epimerase/dehydratase family protein [Microbacterium sp. AZCO]|uniref:NAD-dependent epimerase/dehydratase family protein n=1 Tax=Microbacterium sp. AZCO TaxID=3142976 RepID=UPI0031F33C83
MRALLTGGGGMLGSSIAAAWRSLRPADELISLTRGDVDLSDSDATRRAVADARPDLVIHTAAHVGGIGDKLARPLPYLLENVRLDASVLEAALAADVPSYLYVASAAAYPADAVNPIEESALFGGRLEPANEPYGLAKLTGLSAVSYAARQTGHAYRSILPSNLYGTGDSFDPDRAHLIASTLLKTHRAKESGAAGVEVWGDGTARREFTYAPDIADWLVRSVDEMGVWPIFMNVGSGVDHSIREFYETAADIIGFRGDLLFDPSKPSGVPRRLIDSSVARTHGWSAPTDLRDGMAECYRAYLDRSVNGESS